MSSRIVVLGSVCLLSCACGGLLDAGFNIPAEPSEEAGVEGSEGGGSADAGSVAPSPTSSVPSETELVPSLLPVGPDNPTLLTNDGYSDSWQGEYAALFSAAGGPRLVGMVVSAGGNWPDLDANLRGVTELVGAARRSGAADLPDPVASHSQPLERPANEDIASTDPNDSEGARHIIDISLEYGSAELPLVVAAGGALTEIADAYLLDPTIASRVVVVASLGSATEGGAEMGIPNGELDSWANVIVSSRLRYIQVSARYQQQADVPQTLLEQLPASPFSDWVKTRASEVWDIVAAADQVSVLAVALPEFVTEVERLGRPEVLTGTIALPRDPSGPLWQVVQVDARAASRQIQELLTSANPFKTQ